MGKKPKGKCALCRKECDLTFEHIPPRTAVVVKLFCNTTT